MTEPELIRVFVNGSPVDLPRGATALDAVRALDAAAADGVATRVRAIADSRGLAVDPAAPVWGGTVLRVVSARAPEDAEA
ncbi:MAG TPA: hypothetical protein VJL28_02755 [Gemmatimonadaceae bacterium]|nr:hypothetical protein [Gemmatimonadaceae bacterium]